MKNAVRYYSRTGNTKVAAEAIAKAINEEAVSVDSVSYTHLLADRLEVLILEYFYMF